MVTTVLIDLDDTIFDFRAQERVAMADTLTALGIAPTGKTLDLYHEINRAEWQRLERGETTRERLLTERFEKLFHRIGADASPALARATYESKLASGHIFVDGAEEMLRELSREYDLYLVSNGTARVQAGRLASAGILPYFRGVFISQAVGHNKPSSAFFDAVFAEIGEEKRGESVIVGDSLTSDILGGIGAGIPTVWFNPGGQAPDPRIPATYTVSHLSELAPLLKSI